MIGLLRWLFCYYCGEKGPASIQEFAGYAWICHDCIIGDDPDLQTKYERN